MQGGETPQSLRAVCSVFGRTARGAPIFWGREEQMTKKRGRMGEFVRGVQIFAPFFWQIAENDKKHNI